jgi:hypothetical protein
MGKFALRRYYVFDSLNCHDQQLTLGHLVETRKQSVLEEGEKL